MNIRQFEELVRNRSMRPTAKHVVDGMNVYICDGLSEKGDKYKTWYAVGSSDEKLEYAHWMEFEKYEKLKGGLQIPSKYEMREKAVLEFAKESVSAMKELMDANRKLVIN